MVVLQGRAHFYEGYDMSQLALPARVMHALGVTTLISDQCCRWSEPIVSGG